MANSLTYMREMPPSHTKLYLVLYEVSLVPYNLYSRSSCSGLLIYFVYVFFFADASLMIVKVILLKKFLLFYISLTKKIFCDRDVLAKLSL